MSDPVLTLNSSKLLNVEFARIGYKVSTGFRKPQRSVLKNVSGCFRAGELTAIMGPSGAGKTSLLNVLTGFRVKKFTGKIIVRDKLGGECDWSRYKKRLCYIQQDAVLHPLFTVDEIMRMACDLKLSEDRSNEEAKIALINDILRSLSLDDAKLTRCDALSGGQRKRLALALELIDDRSVLFLDEPTTGLDCSSTAQCASMLKDLAAGGRTVVCTIHQPSAHVFERFDHVYFVTDGYCAYQGEPSKIVEYLEGSGLRCPISYNPADYMIEVLGKEYGDFDGRLVLAMAADDADKWRAPAARSGDRLDEFVTITRADNPRETARCYCSRVVKVPSEWSRFRILLRRFYVDIFRDWTSFYLRFFLHVLIGALISAMFTDSGATANKVVSNMKLLNIVLVYSSFTSLMPMAATFVDELPLLRKEHFNSWYRLPTYYAASAVSHTCAMTVATIVFSAIIYAFSSQPDDLYRFGMFALATWLNNVIGEGLGVIFGTLLKTVDGIFVGSIFVTVALALSGGVCLLVHMLPVVYYFTFASHMRYLNEAMVGAIYGFGRPNLPCADDDITTIDSDDMAFCHFRNSKTIFKQMMMSDENYWIDVGVAALYAVTIRIAAYYTLKKKLSS